ncbi:hypothetical protein AB0G97_36165 [Streptomyces sp. NPDC020755]|uniref:hypothetical protein n=1 Tax=Streptomyces sp. NPDC020755 TaxID=3154790 RepID=UPI0034052D24
MARYASLGGFAEVAPEMESVCDLHRGGSPGAGAFGEEGGTARPPEGDGIRYLATGTTPSPDTLITALADQWRRQDAAS